MIRFDKDQAFNRTGFKSGSVDILEAKVSKCWASCLGKCGGGFSGEHYVSKGMFTGPTVMIQGLPWCKEERKTIGINSAVGKILCRSHNSGLSPMDNEAAKLMRAIRAQQIAYAERSRAGANVAPLHHVINARLIERWLLKTLLSFLFEGQFLIGRSGETIGIPPTDLVEAAFGIRPFVGRAGLHIGVHQDLVMVMDETVQLIPLVQHGRVIGGQFRVAGIMMYLCLDPDGIEVPFYLVPGVDLDWASTELHWRFRKIKFGTGDKQTIKFNW